MPFKHLLARLNRPSWQLAVLLIIAISVCALTVLFYRAQIAALRAVEAANLESIAAVKAEHLASLRSERFNDAVLLSGRPLFNDAYRLWLEAPTPEITAELRQSLAAINSQGTYTNIALFDTAGAERLRLYPGVPLPRCAGTDDLIAQALASGAPQMGDMHRCAPDTPVQWHLAAPLQVQQGGTSVPVGAILLAVNVPQVMLPIVNEWPVASASGETLLAERQGDTAVNLNDFRDGPAALHFRPPITQTDLPIVQAVLMTTTLQAGAGIDYRGVDVLYGLAAVDSSPWRVVAKLDLAEIDAPVTAQRALYGAGALVVFGLLASQFALLILFYRHAILQRSVAAERERAFLSAIVDSSADAVIGGAADGTILSWNEGAARLFGYTAAEATGRPMALLAAPGAGELLQRLADRVARGESAVSMDMRLQGKDARTVDASVTYSLVRDMEHQVIGAALILRDVSERKRQEERIRQLNAGLERRVAERTAELQEANLLLEARVAERTRAVDAARQQAEEANQAKSRFLASMSHELRTPLNAIVGLAQVMEDDSTLSQSQRENVAIIVQSGEHLLSTINEILDLSKIEAGKMELYETDFDLRGVIRTLEAMQQQKAGARQLALAVDVAPGVPQRVHGDQGKLRQVLINLLNNALKFTVTGGVTLKVCVEEDGRIAFAVQDTGPGIAAAELDKLFSEFEQTATGRRSQEGTGLGLPISRKFAVLMGGDLSVTSTAGQGTTFTLRLPLAPAAASAAEAAERRAVAGLAPGSPCPAVLIVDDVANNRAVVRQILQPLGLDVREAASGEAALEIWEAWHPDLIWLDIWLGGMSGTEVARQIRQRESMAGRQPACLIALSASAMAEDVNEIMAAGCDDFVAKPFHRQSIYDMMARHLGLQYRYRQVETAQRPAASTPELEPDPAPEAGAAGQSPRALPPEPPAGRVLVADDNLVGQKLAVRLLRKLHVDVDLAANGAEAIAALRSHPYRLVLMDLQMPVMGGLEAAQRIRAEWGSTHPAIVALTGSTDSDDFLAAQAAGIDGWLVKPLRLEDLQLTLEKWVFAKR